MVIQATSHIPAMIVKLNMLTMVMTTLSQVLDRITSSGRDLNSHLAISGKSDPTL